MPFCRWLQLAPLPAPSRRPGPFGAEGKGRQSSGPQESRLLTALTRPHSSHSPRRGHPFLTAAPPPLLRKPWGPRAAPSTLPSGTDPEGRERLPKAGQTSPPDRPALLPPPATSHRAAAGRSGRARSLPGQRTLGTNQWATGDPSAAANDLAPLAPARPPRPRQPRAAGPWVSVGCGGRAARPREGRGVARSPVPLPPSLRLRTPGPRLEAGGRAAAPRPRGPVGARGGRGRGRGRGGGARGRRGDSRAAAAEAAGWRGARVGRGLAAAVQPAARRLVWSGRWARRLRRGRRAGAARSAGRRGPGTGDPRGTRSLRSWRAADGGRRTARGSGPGPGSPCQAGSEVSLPRPAPSARAKLWPRAESRAGRGRHLAGGRSGRR